MSSAPRVFVVSAPSGAGKSTVLARVLREVPELRFSVSHTTRPPRAGEQEGVQYHFVDRARFEALIAHGRFLEWAEVHGNLYGTTLDEVERAAAEGVDLVLDLDVQGAAQVRSKLPDAVSLFLLPPSREDLETRLRGRGSESEASLQKRLANALAEVARYADYQYAVVNDDLDKTVTAVKAVVLAARCRASRARTTAEKILATFVAGR